MKPCWKIPGGACIVLLALLGLAAMVLAQTPVPGDEPVRAYSEAESARALMLTPGKIFTFFFVMLGPLKILGPFVRSTFEMDVPSSRRLALKGVLIACVAGALAAVVGQRIIVNWGLSSAALLLAAGLIMLLIALRAILSQFQPSPPSVVPEDDPARRISPLSLAFPNIVTPYGVAALILLLAASEGSRDLNIFGIFLGVMVINLAAMWFARPILKYTSGALQILSALFGVLQVALAIQLLIGGFRLLGVVPSIGN